MAERITRAQMAKIWAAAKEMYLDRETLYLLVPRGSMSTLSRAEASDLIERLCGPMPFQRRRSTADAPGPARSVRDHRTPAPATNEQRLYINSLFVKLGWHRQPNRIQGFLRKFAHVDFVEDLTSRKRAIAIIEALKAMNKRRRPRQRRRI